MICEIGIIAPDKELLDVLEELRSEFNEPFVAVNKYLDDAVGAAYTMLNQGIKVLVSRGGTAAKLRQANLPLPIIEIAITEYEVMSLLVQAQKVSSRIGVIGFTDSLMKRAAAIGPMLGLEVIRMTAHSEQEVKEKVREAKNMGINVVVGFKLAAESAKALGMHGFMLTTPKEVVVNAINEAVKVLEAVRKEREWGERLTTILDSIQEGIILVDNSARIVDYNKLANKVLNGNGELLQGHFPMGLFNEDLMIESIRKDEKWMGEIREYNGIKYVFNLNPIAIGKQSSGAILTFQELKRLQTLEQKARHNLYQKGHIAKFQFMDILTCDPQMERVIEKAKNYAQVDSTVLIHGGSGTGKEMFAQSLHNASKRSEGPFVAINCAVLPEQLLESELFGYVEGAFTGARKGGKVGLFELAHGGSLFLDEISEISLAVQARLLRVLEERRIMRIGDDKVTPVNVRIFCATNRDLKLMIKNGQFREDLYYRINILKLELPLLRDRNSDIPLLINFHIQHFSRILNREQLVVSPDAMKLLQNYYWHGNVRELRNVVERLMITTAGEEISFYDVLEVIDELSSGKLNLSQESEPANTPNSLVDQEEFKLILKVLEKTNGNKAEAARQLGISKTTLWRKLKTKNR